MKHRRIVTVFLILVIALTTFACSGPEEKKMKFFNKGKALYEKEEFTKAGLEFRNALQIDPNFADAYFWLGRVEMKKGNPRKAFGAFNKAIDLDPDHVEALIQVATILSFARQPEKALEKIDAALSIDSTSEDALLTKSTILLSQKRIEEAEMILRNLIETGCTRPRVYQYLALAYDFRDDPSGSESIIREGIEKNPTNVNLQLRLAKLLESQERYDEAEKLLLNVCDIDETNRLKHKTTLANFYWNTDQQDKARQLLKEIVEDDPLNETRWLTIIKFYIGNRMFDDAEQQYKAGIEQINDSFTLRIGLAELYSNTKRLDEAITLLEDTLTLDKDPAAPGILRTKNALAKIYFAKKDLNQADAYAQEVLAESPRDRTALFIQGGIALSQSKPDIAVASFRSVVSDNPEFTPAYLKLAQAHLMNRDLELAEETLKTALRVKSVADVHRSLARVLTLKEKYLEAEEHLRIVLAATPDDPQVHSDLGDVFFAAKDIEEAEKQYQQVVLLAPDKPAGHLRLSRLYQSQKDWAKAASELETAYRLSNESPQILATLVRLYLYQGNNDAALEICKRYTEDHPDSPVGFALLGRIYAGKENYSEAEAAFKMAISIQPMWPVPYNDIANLYLRQGKTDAAIKEFKDALAANPQNPGAYLMLGQLYEQMDDRNKAIAIYEEGIANVADFWAAQNNLAFLLAESSKKKADLERALEMAENALETRPGNPMITDTLGWVHYKLGNTDQALGFIQTAVSEDEDNAAINYHMGLLLFETDQADQARPYFEKAVSSTEDFIGKDNAKKLLEELSK